MSVGSNLQEMENVVTKGAAASEPMSKAGSNASGVSTPGQTGNWEDLGGPTPENYKVDKVIDKNSFQTQAYQSTVNNASL